MRRPGSWRAGALTRPNRFRHKGASQPFGAQATTLLEHEPGAARADSGQAVNPLEYDIAQRGVVGGADHHQDIEIPANQREPFDVAKCFQLVGQAAPGVLLDG
jgi:hypothetical protein